MTQPFLEGRRLTRRFPGVLAVDDVDFTVAAGEIVGLVGPNGAGKSTLIKMLAGAEVPDAGEIRIDGEHVGLTDPHHATMLGLSFVHQELADVPNLSVAENVQLGLRYPRRLGFLVDRRAVRAQALQALSRLDTELDPDELVGSLSVVQQRLVMIARGLASDAKVLVLDEPTASLTNDDIERLHAVVRRVAAEGTAIVYVSHRLDEIIALTERVVVMRAGRVVADVPTAALERSTLIDHITGQSREVREAIVREAAAETLTIEDHDRAPRPILRVEGLTKESVVEDACFALHSGEVLGIAGMVGAGRTELMRLIYGADACDSGQVFIDEEPVQLRSPSDAMAAGIVLLPEDRRQQGLVLGSSIRDNITLPSLSRFRAVPKLPFPVVSRERTVVRGMVEDLSLAASSQEQAVGFLSGGNQQKVVLAKWLLHGARIFIFDEPTLGVDVSGKREVYERMVALAAEGNGVIFVSSEFEELTDVCGRVLIMREGRLVDEVRGEQLTTANLIARCYGAESAPAAM